MYEAEIFNMKPGEVKAFPGFTAERMKGGWYYRDPSIKLFIKFSRPEHELKREHEGTDHFKAV